MFSDRQRPARVRSEQDRALRRALARELYPFADAHRDRLDGVGLQRGRISGMTDLARVAPVGLHDIADPAALLLRPDEHRIRRHGHWTLWLRLAAARVLGRQAHFGRTRIDPVYKPVLWFIEEGVPVGASAADVDQLAEIGRRWLETVGVAGTDVLVSVLPGGADMASWQMTLGARRANLSAIHLGPGASPSQVAGLRPDVLVGTRSDLVALATSASAESRRFLGVRIVIVVGVPDDAAMARVSESFPAATVTSAFSPAGVRSVWVSCHGGTGLHTWPATELIEVVDRSGAPVAEGSEGEIVWTSTGWRGTTFVRLATGMRGRLDRAPCPACGRTTPRVLPPRTAAITAALDASDVVTAWQLETRRVAGEDELLVFVAVANGDVNAALHHLDHHVGATQYVVLSPDEVLARVAEHGKVLDLGP